MHDCKLLLLNSQNKRIYKSKNGKKIRAVKTIPDKILPVNLVCRLKTWPHELPEVTLTQEYFAPIRY